ncbi:hypothetical protein HAU13_10930 [Weissella confusa]|uniref:hypothetical protein n=1 Tax=Weissella confusa TaxID=1583 RepID=UPI0018F11176|nr:hypothetical protein [Weissella confusa]MBJ7623222.1 hypothetical protein [Weissella confusa]
MQQIQERPGKAPKIDPSLKGIRKIWNRYKVWQYDFKYDFYDKVRRNLVFIFLAFTVTGIGLIVYTNVTPRPSSVASTPLNAAQSFGLSGKTATLFSETFNPDNNTLLLKFALAIGSGDVDSAVDTRNIKVDVEGNGTGDATMHIIPTSKNTVAILFNNVNPNFQSVKVKVADKQTNALASSAPDTVSALSSSRAAASSAKKNDDGIATFIINSDKLKTDKTLVSMTQKKLALLQVKSDITDQKKLLAANNSAIKNANKDIKELQKDITFQSSQKQNATADEQQQYQQTIDNDLNKIQDLTQKIATTRDTIQTINQKISNLESRQDAIKNGQVNLPKPY